MPRTVNRVKTPPAAAALIAATSIAALIVRFRRASAPARSFRVSPTELPLPVIDRLRHPGEPTYLVSWDRTAHTTLWRPTLEPR